MYAVSGERFANVSCRTPKLERAVLDTETQEVSLQPDAGWEEMTALYEARGLSAPTARQAATELTAHDPLAAHAELELRIDPEASRSAPAISSARRTYRQSCGKHT
jgi:VIT1/CCC1 family predicted Fe2+/Mn2+ transporter